MSVSRTRCEKLGAVVEGKSVRVVIAALKPAPVLPRL